jgi:hypothetical protein
MTRLLFCALVFMCVIGCGQEDVARIRDGASLTAETTATAEGFGADVVLCRRVGSKTGKRIAVGDSFVEDPEKRNRYIHAFLDVTGAPLDVHQVHLVWIKPDGKEMFRKSAEVTVTATTEGFATDVVWFKAEDLHDRDADETLLSDSPDFTLQARLNVAPQKERVPGEYALRVYWNRELMVEKTFQFNKMAS